MAVVVRFKTLTWRNRNLQWKPWNFFPQKNNTLFQASTVFFFCMGTSIFRRPWWPIYRQHMAVCCGQNGKLLTRCRKFRTLNHMQFYLGVSKNNGIPKSSILVGFSIIFTIHFGVALFLETSIFQLNNNLQNEKDFFFCKKAGFWFTKTTFLYSNRNNNQLAKSFFLEGENYWLEFTIATLESTSKKNRNTTPGKVGLTKPVK